MRFLAAPAILTAVVAALLVGAFGGVAEARTTIDARLFLSAGKQRLLVTMSNGRRPFTARNRPRSVVVRYVRLYRRLADVTPRTASGARARTASWWRSAAGVDMARLANKRVGLTVRTAAGTETRLIRVTPSPTIFDGAPNNTRGETAFQRIKQYFVGSRFTDCPQGWPACSTERRYDHCAGGDLTGNLQYREFPPTPTSDVNAPYRVTDAYHSTSGSWGVTYELPHPSGARAVYTWSVAPNGRVSGAYGVGDNIGSLTGFRWQRSAAC